MPLSIGTNSHRNPQTTAITNQSKTAANTGAVDSLTKTVVPAIKQIANGVVQAASGTVGTLLNTKV